MKRLAFIVTVFIISIAIVIPASAQRGGRGKAGGMGQGGMNRPDGAMRQGSMSRSDGAMRQGSMNRPDGAVRQGSANRPDGAVRQGGANLTTEQREAMQESRKAFLDDTAGLRNDIKTKQTEIRDLRKTDGFDESEVSALRQELHELNSQLSEKKLEFRQDQLEVTQSEDTEE